MFSEIGVFSSELHISQVGCEAGEFLCN